MNTKAITTSLVLIALLTQFSAASRAQGAVDPAADTWILVRTVPVGEKLSVKLKNGKTIEGRVHTATDTLLSLLRKDKVTDINRAEIKKVYRFLDPEEEDDKRRAAGAGAALGLLGGVIVATGVGLSRGSDRGAKKAVAVAAIPVGAVLGALAGYAIGKKQSRDLIYEAR